MTEIEKKIDIAQKKKNLVNAVRAMSLLLLALLLAIFAAFAWFGKGDTSTVTGTGMSTSGSDLSIRENEDQNAAPTINDEVFLPAATNINDSTISKSDLSKVLAYKSYTVTGTKSGYVKVSVSGVSASSQLHYVITSADPSGDNWAAAIKGGTAAVDTAETYIGLTQTDGEYSAQVYLVLYGDYADGGIPYTAFPDSSRDEQGSRKVQLESVTFDFTYSETNSASTNS